MTTILYILLAILMFGVLILVHEWGHFITAKKLGVQVNEFAIGMGPVLWLLYEFCGGLSDGGGPAEYLQRLYHPGADGFL